MRALTVVLVAVPAWLQMACATGTSRIGGADVVVRVRAPESARPVRGELIAVGPQKVVLIDDGVREIAREDIRRIDLVRRKHGGRGGAIITLLGAAISSFALGNACTSPESLHNLNGRCGQVALRTAAVWAVIGGISSLDLLRSSKQRFPARRLDELRPFARFPQGVPPELGLEDILPKPGAGGTQSKSDAAQTP
jgi:hypothetical protein